MAIYVIYTHAENEDEITRQIRRIALLEGEDVYVPMYLREKKRKDTKRIVYAALFPGYIFCETKDPEDLRQRLKKVEGLTKLLRNSDGIAPLYEDEERLIRKLCGKSHILEISKGIIEGGRAKVIQGPLMGMEPLIKKVNRKHMTAVIEVELFRRKTEVTVGLEIIQDLEETR